MNEAKANRGRPKGSGIDDAQKLKEIETALCLDPRMKPTTAIKAIGITDPSVIRRLRDKYNLAHAQQMSNPRVEPVARTTQQGQQLPASAGYAANDPAPALRAAPLRVADLVKHADPLPPIELGHGMSGLLSVKTSRVDTMPIAALFFGFGLNAATAIFEQQMMIAQSMMKLPPVRDLVRSQIALTEFMWSIPSRSPGSRLTH
jgi:hypothetical protein